MLHSRFFTRKGINFSYVSDSLLARVDCSKIDQWAHEELFMNTREALADSEFRRKVEAALQKQVGENSALKEFNHQRRAEKIKEKVKDDKTLEDVIKSVMKKSPALSALFLTGERLTDLVASVPSGSQPEFEGQEFPTYFRFRKLGTGETKDRNCEEGREVRLSFETDAENNYFGRPKEKGGYVILLVDDEGNETVVQNHSMSLHNGSATLRLDLPDAKAGNLVKLKVLVTDNSRLEPFTNQANITVIPFVDRESIPGKRREAPSKKSGNETMMPSGLTLPHVQWVEREEWDEHGFDKYSALKVIQAEEGSDAKNRAFDFYINSENIYFLKELERAKGTESLLREQFKVGMVLVGLALIHEAGKGKDGDEIAELVAYSTRAISMMLIPMINFLGDLDPSELKAEIAA